MFIIPPCLQGFYCLFIYLMLFDTFRNITRDRCVFVCVFYLPGVTAPPAGLRGDAQPLAAGLLGHKGELSHCAASEIVEVRCHSNAHHGCPGNQEEEEDGEGDRVEMHAGKNGEISSQSLI